MLIKTTPLEDMFEIKNYLMELRFKFRTDEVAKADVEKVILRVDRVIDELELLHKKQGKKHLGYPWHKEPSIVTNESSDDILPFKNIGIRENK